MKKVSNIIPKLGSILFLLSPWIAFAQEKPPAEQAPSAPTPPAVEKPKLPDIPKNGMKTSEALRIREELEWMRKDVEQKIVRLEEAKSAYDKSKENVTSQLKKVEEERRLLDETLQKEKNIKEERLKETVDFVAKMEPRAVAPILESMDRDLVMALFTKLPQRQVTKILQTKILQNMAPPKATQLLEYFTHIRSGREFEMLKDMGLCSASKENDAKVQSNSDPAKPK